MNLKTILFFLFVLLFNFGRAQTNRDSLLLPVNLTDSGEIIKHNYYQLAYSEVHEQAAWVFYMLTSAFINGPAERKNKFKPDDLVATGSAELVDYKGSGYDRGHLCPAGAMKINQLAMDESFFMSNMSPQAPSFNRGRWKQLEAQVRKWVAKEDTLFVVTGPIFTDSLGVIGVNKVTIPAYYYKVIYDPTGKEKMIAFIMPNRKIANNIFEYVVTVDEVEQKTGIDFFPGLPDELEMKLEKETVFW